jgi:AcrR family transcriptional regulator
MDELAEAAGVARQTLYNQFASKCPSSDDLRQTEADQDRPKRRKG